MLPARPLHGMPAMPDTPAPYVPINCEFHDVLEATATRPL